MSAFTGPIDIFGEPGFHGTVTGVHGPGVSTPNAAAVSEAVVGLARLLHNPNGRMFMNGTQSVTTAAGFFSIVTGSPFGTTTSVDGASPIEHIVIAPVVTGRAIAVDHTSAVNPVTSRTWFWA